VAFAESATNLIVPMLPLLAKTAAQVFSAAAVLWAAISALGRGVITREVVGRLAKEQGVTTAPDAPRWASFALLQSARVVMLLILVIGYLGGVFLSALVGGGQNVFATVLVIFSSLVVSGIVWSYVNWVLSLAPLFVVRDGMSALSATVEAVDFIRRHRSQLRTIALRNSSQRGVAAVVITLAGVVTAGLSVVWVSTVLLTLETLAYLVVSDAFLLARLVAYASVAVGERKAGAELAGLMDHSGIVVL
jgi:hypothetical protein